MSVLSPGPRAPHEPFDDRTVDILVSVGAFLVMAVIVMLNVTPPAAPSARPDPAEVHEIELRAIAQDASEALPAEVRDAIGLEGQALATRAGVLTDVGTRLDQRPWVGGLRLIWIATAVGWREDALAREGIAAIARDPARLESLRAPLDELTRLANGQPAKDLPSLDATFDQLGASRWLRGKLRVRHLENQGDPSAQKLAAELTDIASGVASRHAIFFVIEVALVGLGLIVLLIFPGFIRPRLLAGGRMTELGPSPFRLDRTRRVMLAWFIGYQIAGLTAVMLLGAGPRSAALAMPLSGLLNGLVAVFLIRHWGRPADAARPLHHDLGLSAEGSRSPLRLALWLVPAMALCAALTWIFELLNRQLLGAPPETQSSLKLLLSEGDPLTLGLIAFGAVLVAPLVEEILFRGYLFRNLREHVGRGLATLVAGLIFAAVHLHPTLLLPLTGLGVALALLYEWSGSIWVPILAHATWNLLTLISVEATWRI